MHATVITLLVVLQPVHGNHALVLVRIGRQNDCIVLRIEGLKALSVATGGCAFTRPLHFGLLPFDPFGDQSVR